VQTTPDTTVTPCELGEALAALLARHPGEEASVSADGPGYFLCAEDEAVELGTEALVESA
jgi:hypothetical protein